MSTFTESTAERAALQWLDATLPGHATLPGADAAPGGDRPQRTDYAQAILPERLHAALVRLNPTLPPSAIAEAEAKVARLEGTTLIDASRAFHEFIAKGVPVEVPGPDGVPREVRARLFDFEHPGKAEGGRGNDLLAINQFTFRDPTTGHTDRADIVAFVNGLPLVVVELKDPGNQNTGFHEAYAQLDRYRREVPGLLAYAGLLIASDGLLARVGTVTSGADRFMPWRTMDGVAIAPKGQPELETLVRGMLRPDVLLDLLRRYTVFETVHRTARDGTTRTEVHRKVAAYHQYWAVKKAVRSVEKAARAGGDGKGRGGVVWHTQGSGKSLSMLCLAGELAQSAALENPTLVVLTDRNDLDNQLFGTFAASAGVLREAPVRADTRADLVDKLRVESGGLVFTTIQKFMERDEPLTERRNVVVIADEAHRSQYGFIKGFAVKVRKALPNATFVGFTGTPIETQDKNTRGVFGEYIDVYDIQRAIDDGATVPIYYESKLVQLRVADPNLDLDEAFREAAEKLEIETEEARTRVDLEDLVGAPKRVEAVAAEIVGHFEERQKALDGKAMVVCMSRDICVRLYEEIRRLRPDWHDADRDKGRIKVVMTGAAGDPKAYEPHTYTKAQRERLAERFKDPADPFQIAIVCDMWLTGFDVPCLHTMYVDKPMVGHTLMQAIARVNRVFGDKPGGLIVDLLGIAAALKEALATYTHEGGTGKPAFDQREAVPVMERCHEVCRAFFKGDGGFSYAGFFGADPAAQMATVMGGADWILRNPDGRERFLDAVAQLSRAFALAVPLPETEKVRDDLGYFQAVRVALKKLDPASQVPKGPDVSPAVRQVISGAIASGEVVDIFKAAGLDRPNVAILGEGFLAELKKMRERHLALEALRKLLNDEVRARSRVNIVQGRAFAEMLAEAMNRYRNKSIDAAQVLDELIQIARHVRADADRGKALGLNDDEVAFYDALALAKNAKEAMGDDTLRALARELARRIRENASIDWTMKEQVRAQMRAIVKRLLRKCKYPPEVRDAATETVIEQAERMAENHAL